MKLYAHRGASTEAPENSMAAFQRALDLGVEGIELDVRATSDGVPIVLHDRSLARTTGNAANVDETLLDSLREVDAGDGEPVPTLAEVLSLVGDRAHLDVEIKQPGIECAVLDELARHPHVRWAISSFDWDILRTLRQLSPEAELWPLSTPAGDELVAVATELRSPAVALWEGSLTEDVMARLRAAGLTAMVWTVNDPGRAREVQDLGATALCTDEPALMLAELGPSIEASSLSTRGGS